MPEPTEEQRKAFEEKIKNMSPEELREFQKQQCIFCQIIDGKVPSKKVYEDSKCIAVMDINPAAVGHVLLLPKEHYSIMPQVPEKEIGYLFTVAKHLSQAMLRKLKVSGTNIFVANGPVAGQNSQHFMIHIIPRTEGDGLLEVPQHPVDKNVIEKLGEVLGKKAEEVFGVKRKVKKAPVEEEAPVEEPQEELVEEPKEEKPKETEEPTEEESTPEEPAEEEKPEEPVEEEKKEKDGDETDLDNIAELFK
ncbi:HIT domain-containing protein [Candidatus Woesearchaeota archaeon]|nr:HIT domain-containing protein [Candidatus Woesearchaeota archaeon]